MPCGAYATLDNASEANTGNAIRFGSRVCANRSLRNARPTTTRFTADVTVTTSHPPHGPPEETAGHGVVWTESRTTSPSP